MTSKDFYDCTWYDWSVWCERIKELRRKRIEDQELIIEMFRSSLTCYYNWNRGKDDPAIDKTSFWKLSYDSNESEVTDREPSEEEKEKLAATIKRLETANKKIKRG
jgi:hypothetical protein